MKKVILSLIMILSPLLMLSQQTEKLYLSGTGMDDTKTWEFLCTKGRRSNVKSTIEVPSCWELQGFGTFNYGAKPELLADEKGFYGYDFNVPVHWRNKVVRIVFEGSMTDTEVFINGRSAGPVHRGSFYRFSYDIGRYLRYGQLNRLEVTVSKMSSDMSINRAEREVDFWVFGGIFRPVYLEAYPAQYIERTAIDAKADGRFEADIYVANAGQGMRVEAVISDSGGDLVTEAVAVPIRSGTGKVTVTAVVKDPGLWSPETPELYSVIFRLRKGEKVIHEITDKFGFRTVEVRQNDGIYVNGMRTVFRGVNRHTSWPESGRTTSKKLSIADVGLMKEMNMNAVRMSHYPPDTHFLDACDSLGLYVIDELTGWQKSYSTEAGRPLVKEMVTRDVNHPSVIVWANGNEGGFNFDLDEDFSFYDPQKRPVIHPWENFRGIVTSHYKPYDYGMNIGFHGRDIFFPTEMLHGLYDGGAGSGLDDLWKLVLSNPVAAGGFLWVFADEGIIRDDQEGAIDVVGERAPDGIVGPFREKEGSFYTVKEIWSPVYIDLPYINPAFDGRIEVTNQFQFTDIGKCRIEWSLADFRKPSEDGNNVRPALSGTVKLPGIGPGEKGFISIDLPEKWREHDALILTAYYPDGSEMNRWSWPVKTPGQLAAELVDTTSVGEIVVSENDSTITIEASGVVLEISRKTGYLENARNRAGSIGFGEGPVLAHGDYECRGVRHYAEDGNHVVEVDGGGNTRNFVWTIYPSGWLRLDYGYALRGEMDFAGINFSYPEEKITGVTWLGRGPYRVWKNRLKGVPFGLHSKEYNRTMTGRTWDYPEFKGYHSDFYWATFENADLPFTVVSATHDLYLRLFTPDRPEEAVSNTVFPPFPAGDISFLHGIAPMGTKFHKSSELGPQGFPNMLYSMRGDVTSMTLYFDFRAR